MAAQSAAPKSTLVWDDLIPKFENEIEDPMAAMELYRRLELETIIWARSLTDEERELGCALVELGVESTTGAIFHDNKLRHLSSDRCAGWRRGSPGRHAKGGCAAG